MSQTKKIILGIDPGSQNTGFGVVAVELGRITYLEHGVVSASPSLSFLERIELIANGVSKLVTRVSPAIVVVEKIFLGKNADSAFKLGHIRGVCLVEALKMKSEIVEYAARSVKKGITGSGASSKQQVQMMLAAVLGIRTLTSEKLDASDALALAFYHGRMLEFDTRLKRQLSREKDML